MKKVITIDVITSQQARTVITASGGQADRRAARQLDVCACAYGRCWVLIVAVVVVMMPTRSHESISRTLSIGSDIDAYCSRELSSLFFIFFGPSWPLGLVVPGPLAS